MTKNLTRDIILIIIVLGGVVSVFWWNPLLNNAKYLQALTMAIVGYYIGVKEIPVVTTWKAIKK